MAWATRNLNEVHKNGKVLYPYFIFPAVHISYYWEIMDEQMRQWCNIRKTSWKLIFTRTKEVAHFGHYSKCSLSPLQNSCINIKCHLTGCLNLEWLTDQPQDGWELTKLYSFPPCNALGISSNVLNRSMNKYWPLQNK